MTVLRVTGSTPKGVRLPIYLEGAAVERVIEVPDRVGDRHGIAPWRPPDVASGWRGGRRRAGAR